MREFRVQVVAGVPCAVFEGEDEEAWVRAAFLSEATSFLEDLDRTLDSASRAADQTASFQGNEVILDVRSGKAVITAQWIKDSSSKEYSIIMPLTEAKELLSRWRVVLAEHRPA